MRSRQILPLAMLMVLWIRIPANAQSLIEWSIPDKGIAFEQLFKRMESIDNREDETLVILYIGGSHVQAGWIGHGLRQELAAWAPNTQHSRGLMLPYRIANTNTPTHFRTEFTGAWNKQTCIGKTDDQTRHNAPVATGISVHPKTNSNPDKHWIQHVSYFPDSSRVRTSHLTLWTNAQFNEWKWAGNTPLKTSNPLPNGNGWQIELSEPADTIAIEFIPERGRDIWYAGMNTSAPVHGPTCIVHEWGHNGLRASHASKLEGWEDLLKTLQPDLIFMGLGLNDAIVGNGLNMEQFQSHYAQLINALQQSGAAIVLMTNTPLADDLKAMAGASQTIKAFFQDYAYQHNLGFWDFGKAIELALENGTTEVNPWYKPDGIHFTKFGYTQMSQILFAAWHDSYTSWSKSIGP